MAPLGDLFLWILNVLSELQKYPQPTNQPTERGNSFTKTPFSIPPMDAPVQSGEGAEHKGLFVPPQTIHSPWRTCINNSCMTHFNAKQCDQNCKREKSLPTWIL